MTTDIEQRKLAAIMFTDMVGYSALDLSAIRRWPLPRSGNLAYGEAGS